MGDQRKPRIAFGVALLLAVVTTPYAASPVWAAFTATTTTASSSLSAKRIFSGTRAVEPHNLHDASNGTDTDNSDLVYASDTLKYVTGNWTNAYSATRYLDFDFEGPNPAGVAVSSVTFDLGYADSKGGGAESACYYFEVRRISTGVVLGTHGSSGASVSCNTANTFVVDHTSIVGEVTSTDLANDLRIRVYMTETAKVANWIDLATVTVTTPYATRTEYADQFNDQSTGTASNQSWGLAASDAANYQSKANWPSSYATTKYLSFTFPASVPTGATINSVSLVHSYRPQAAATLCYYFEVYSGGALIGTHGSSSSDVSCNASATTFVTDTIALPEVSTVALANAVVVKMYMKINPGKPSQHDVVSLRVNYSLT